MTEAQRREAAQRLRELLDARVPRKVAFLQVQQDLRSRGLPASRGRIYEWCRRFGVSTR